MIKNIKILLLILTCSFVLFALPGGILSAYSYSGHHWDYGNPRTVGVTIKIEVPNAWTAAITRSMSAWNNATSKFKFNANSQNHMVGFKRLTRYPNALAVTYVNESGTRITDRDTDINSMYSWDVNGDRNKYDVQSVMAHEFGHWLMLYDLYSSSDYWKTMYGYTHGPGATDQRSLEQDDINGIRAIYGN